MRPIVVGQPIVLVVLTHPPPAHPPARSMMKTLCSLLSSFSSLGRQLHIRLGREPLGDSVLFVRHGVSALAHVFANVEHISLVAHPKFALRRNPLLSSGGARRTTCGASAVGGGGVLMTTHPTVIRVCDH